MAGVRVHVETFGLEERFALFTDLQARRAIRSAAVSLGGKGRTLVRQKTPVKTGASRAGITSKTRSAGTFASALIFPGGPHAHVTRWQDQGTGPRAKKSNGQYTGMVEPQYMFERTAPELDAQAGAVVDAAISGALRRAGL